jgi:hypothetical protein
MRLAERMKEKGIPPSYNERMLIDLIRCKLTTAKRELC